MSTLDDLLSQRRRAPLSDADERRVQIGVMSSADHQLALLAGEAFDRAGAAQPGDAELVRKIVRQVEGEWSGTFQRQAPARPKWSRWAAVPTLIAGVAAASWGGERLLHSLRGSSNDLRRDPAAASSAVSVPAPNVPAPSVPAPSVPAPAARDRSAGELGAPRAAPLAVEASPAAAPSERESSVAKPAAAAPASRSAITAATPELARVPSALRSPAPVLLRPAAPRAAVTPEPTPQPSPEPTPEPTAGAVPGLELGPGETARSLFLRANRLRRDDWTAAAVLYEQLTRRFGDSTEAGVAEMALGKHALAEGHPSQALSWFRAYQQRPNGELTSEALWGEARALESLGEAAAARAVWRRLLSEYPGSAYAAVARQQLGS